MTGRYMKFVPREEIYANYVKKLSPISIVEILDVREALGRICAQDVLSGETLPGFNKSTFDGYAVKAEDTFGASFETPAVLKVKGQVEMGKAFKGEITSGEAVKIPTGGFVPNGADACVMIESTKEIGDTVEIYAEVRPGENLVRYDEDIREGEIVVEKGERINFGHVYTLLSLGITTIKVFRKVKVAVISTGDEIVEPESAKELTQIRDGNTHTLVSWLNLFPGVEARRTAQIVDDLNSLISSIKEALKDNDVVVISGGSSVGEKDFTTKAISSLGEVRYHGTWIKPGKPTVFGVCDGKPVLGLPGKPSSFIVSSYLFLFPILKRLAGQKDFLPVPAGMVKIEDEVEAKMRRERFFFVKVFKKDGKMCATIIPGQSMLISPFRKADGIIALPPGEGIKAGEIREYYRFDW
ncbi:MAG: molybdopterin molybdotransferase [Kosmotoga sp.]|nr:molybdopterin molybdotransferase [Kosmotoga sp.]